MKMEWRTVTSVNERTRLYYMTIFAQCFSPCGKYLIAGNNYGTIAIFNISNILNPDSTQVQDKDLKFPTFAFQAHNGPIYALIGVKDFLISAGVGDILAWSWSDIFNKHAKVAWSLPISESEVMGKPETNAIVLGENGNSNMLFSGGGDHFVYQWDLETRTKKAVFQGHTDYIHCLTSNQNEVTSGSEDGSVRIWDVRKPNNEAMKIEPHKAEQCSRPKFGKWIGCVSVDDGNDWMVCGGGPALTLWHLASLKPTTTFNAIEDTLSSCGFHEDLVIAGGGDPYFYHLSFDGDLKAKIPSSASSIYSIVKSNIQQNELVSIAGTSHKIDVCPSFKYRDFILYFV